MPAFDGRVLTIASVIYDTLQGWAKDSRGHNFRYVLGPTALPVGGQEYAVEVQFTLTDGSIGWAKWAIKTQDLAAG